MLRRITCTARLLNRFSSLTINQTLKQSTNPVEKPEPPRKEISKAMQVYLQRAKEHDEFMEAQTKEFQIGKRHLANMMGADPEHFTQADVDAAIEYLFPSGLYEPKARPMMKPPEEIFPKRKAAEFDESGRPHHFLFYTSKPNFYKLLYDIVENIQDLNKYEDSMIRKSMKPDPNMKFDMTGFQWLDKTALEKKLVEVIGDQDYGFFVSAFDRLSEMPYSYKKKDFISEYRTALMKQTKTMDIPKLQYDDKERAFVTTYECLRKRARADVTLRSPGTGIVSINGEDLRYFGDIQSREQILFPLIFTDMHTKVDVEANVAGGGFSGQAGAIRWGIAMGLRSFVDEEQIEKMRLAGLLTRDYRTRERKKPGQWRARKKFTWKKR